MELEPDYIHRFFVKIIFFFILIYFLSNSFMIYIGKDSDFNDLKKIEEFIKRNINGDLIHPSNMFHKMNNPKISIIISVFNGEPYLKSVIHSIQNQDFLEIEIIVVDDFSRDNSILIIEELMNKDPRIELIKNKENKGTLYTKSTGIMYAKGKFIMTLDQDDFYGSEYAFSTLYSEAEKLNLDLLGFSLINTTINMRKKYNIKFINYFQTSLIYKPKIKQHFLHITNISLFHEIKYNNINQTDTLLCLFFIKSELLKKVIKILGNEFLCRNIDTGDDSIIVFLLSRYAFSYKHMKRIFYIVLLWPKKNNPKIIFQQQIKTKERERKRCYSYLTFIYALYYFSENDELDKRMVSYYLLELFLNNTCRNNTSILNDSIKVCREFLFNKYIKLDIKKEIISYFKEIKYNPFGNDTLYNYNHSIK